MAHVERRRLDPCRRVDQRFYHVNKVVVTLFTEYLHRVGALIGVVHNGCDVWLVWRAWESLLDMCEYARGGHKRRIGRDVSEPVQTGAEVRVCGRHYAFF